MEIKELRKRLGITQHELGTRLGVSVRTVQNWESGASAIPSTTMARLEAMLNTDGDGDADSNLSLALQALQRSQDEIDRLIALLEKVMAVLVLFVFLVPSSAVAQRRLTDTVVGDVRWAMIRDGEGEVSAFMSAVPFDETESVIDLNRRLRSIAAYQSVAVPCAFVAPLALAKAYSVGVDGRLSCDRPGIAALGYGAAAAGIVFGVLSYAQLWTPRIYVNQEGLVFRLDGKRKAYYLRELEEGE